MKVFEYVLEYVVDLHRFELKKAELQSNDYMDYYNAVVINDNVVRLDSPCLVSFDKVMLYSEKNDDTMALNSLLDFLKTFYRNRIFSTQSALKVLCEQYPDRDRIEEPLEDVDIMKEDD